MFCLILNKYEYFHPPNVVGRSNKTQYKWLKILILCFGSSRVRNVSNDHFIYLWWTDLPESGFQGQFSVSESGAAIRLSNPYNVLCLLEYTVVQSQTPVSAYLTSTQIQPFAIAGPYSVAILPATLKITEI